MANLSWADNPMVKYHVCGHPKWEGLPGETKWVGINLVTMIDGAKHIENPDVIPDFCPLGMTTDRITPDMPPDKWR